MTRPHGQADARRLRSRARLLEFLKFRVLAAQEAFFQAWCFPRSPAPSPPVVASIPAGSDLPPIDLVAFRAWLQPLWPEADQLGDDDLAICLEQAHRLYIDAGPAAPR